MQKERLYIFDTTLRDGQQAHGVDFSVQEKNTIAKMLDNLGIDYIEGGYPGANPTDTAFFHKPPKLKTARLTAFGMTKRPGRSAENDPDLSEILNTSAPAICLVAKSWDFHVHTALAISLKENLDNIAESIQTTAAKRKEPMMDAEHFFDGYKTNPQYAMQCLHAALDAGAKWIILCDTNGGTQPHEISEIVSKVCEKIPGQQIGIHAHNDTEQAVANSLAAIRAGARQIQGTINGLGERCGNANLVSILPTLLFKKSFHERFQTAITAAKLKDLTLFSRNFDDLLNRRPNPYAPYVGQSAFAHKGGIHVSAVLKDPRTYEHLPPEKIGNRREILVSRQAGKSNILDSLAAAGIKAEPKDPRLAKLLAHIKEREHLGYAYDDANASFRILAESAFGRIPNYFTIPSYRVIVERRNNAQGKRITVAEAVVKTHIAGEEYIGYGEGNGPVNALDHALRESLRLYKRPISDLRLLDYKVRILTSGTEAVTRVVIESAGGSGASWRTVGISPNIVEASFQALRDSVLFKFLAEKVAPRGEKPGKTEKTPKTLKKQKKRPHQP